MKSNYRKITIIRASMPPNGTINDQLQWLGGSMGLFNLRDKDKSCFRIFIELLKVAKRDNSISSDELSERLMLSRGTVVHHLNKLMEAGIVIHRENHYTLRSNSLEGVLEEVEREMDRFFEDMRGIAEDIDRKLN
ncbi:MAG: ArsR family transcriptional regulator [Nanoarchaeota archaeon]